MNRSSSEAPLPLAVRYPNRRLLWDGEKMEVTNDKEANSFVKRAYREGWSLQAASPTRRVGGQNRDAR